MIFYPVFPAGRISTLLLQLGASHVRLPCITEDWNRAYKQIEVISAYWKGKRVTGRRKGYEKYS